MIKVILFLCFCYNVNCNITFEIKNIFIEKQQSFDCLGISEQNTVYKVFEPINPHIINIKNAKGFHLNVKLDISENYKNIIKNYKILTNDENFEMQFPYINYDGTLLFTLQKHKQVLRHCIFVQIYTKPIA